MEGRKEVSKEGMKEGRKEGRKEGKKERRKEGRKEGLQPVSHSNKSPLSTYTYRRIHSISSATLENPDLTLLTLCNSFHLGFLM